MVALAVLAAGCTSVRQSSSAAIPSATTSGSTAAPTPLQTADLVLTQELVFAWDDPQFPGNIPYQVIVEFKNQGKGWAQVTPDSSSKVPILDATGAVTLDFAGLLDNAFPEFVGPGQKGYLFGNTTQPNRKVSDFASVEYALGAGSAPGVQVPGSVACHCFTSVAPPTLKFEVSGITWRSDGSHPGLVASGSITTSGTNTIPFALVGVLCIGADGSILGATTQSSLLDLQPNQPTAFETINHTPPLNPSDCASSRGFLGPGVRLSPGD